MGLTMLAQLQRDPSLDEIAAGFQPDRTTGPGAPSRSQVQTQLDMQPIRWPLDCPPLAQASTWQINTERSARSMLGGAHILVLSTCLCAGTGFAATAPEWHASATGLGFIAQSNQVNRPMAVAAMKGQQVHQRLLTASVGTQTREALASLGISKTHLAEILLIERPHLYAWLADSVKQPAKGERLRELLMALHAAGIAGNDPLRSHLLTEPLEPGAKPLLTMLKIGDLGSAVIASALATAARLNRAISSEASQRQARMRAAGHQASSDDEAQATLDATLSSMEWD